MKFVKHRPFKAQITVEVPGAEGADDMKFTAHFIALSMDELKSHKLETAEEQDAYLRAIFVGWDGITDDTEGEDKPLPFTPENRDMLIGDLFIRRALQETYASTMAGQKRGN